MFSFPENIERERVRFALYFCIIRNVGIMEIVTTAPVLFTASAISELKRLVNEESFNQSQILRIGVKGGGCSGMTYVLGFDKQEAEDENYEVEGISFVMNKSHKLYLYGMTIDWQGGLNSRGFTFSNPNASKTCGCGTSFAV
jgi:iron-sulfur cluster assembly accessory protein